MSWQKGEWRNGKKRLTGKWYWDWARQRFFISLDGKDPVTDLSRQPFEVAGEEPEWGRWKLKEKE